MTDLIRSSVIHPPAMALSISATATCVFFPPPPHAWSLGINPSLLTYVIRPGHLALIYLVCLGASHHVQHNTGSALCCVMMRA